MMEGKVDETVCAGRNIPGMIALMDQQGNLSVNYLGTDPPTSAVIQSETKDLDYEQIDAQHQQLLQTIRQSQGGTVGCRSSC